MREQSSKPAAWSRCLLALALLLPGSVLAATHALLVGVSHYPALPASLQLQGPGNDVQAFRELFLQRGVAAAQLQVLADGVKGAQTPTRANILSALASLASQLGPQDHAILYFAGHGSQQPAAATAAEPDGLDEIFLPQDIGRWNGAKGQVASAITDNEIAVQLSALTARGASVWAIFDTCHAGSMTRGEASSPRSRGLSPVQLGIPAAARRVAAPLAVQPGMVAFFAAGPDERAPEQPLPEGMSKAPVRGLFSYWLEQELRAQPQASYRQLLEPIVRRYRQEGRVQPTPRALAAQGALDARAP